jgi:hypothetical protein
MGDAKAHAELATKNMGAQVGKARINTWSEKFPFVLDDQVDGHFMEVNELGIGSIVSQMFDLGIGEPQSRFLGVIVGIEVNEVVDEDGDIIEEVRLILDYQLFQETDFDTSCLQCEDHDDLMWHQNYIVDSTYTVVNGSTKETIKQGDIHHLLKGGATREWKVKGEENVPEGSEKRDSLTPQQFLDLD